MGGNPTASATLPGSANALTSAGQGFTQASATQQVFEQSMVDQVRFRLSQGLRSGQQEVVVRMHPRELGEVRLSLTSDDGNLRAHLHVQSQQVQDVLERNMPRLREALAEQGIEVNDFVFSSGEQEQETEYRTFEQERWAGGQPGPGSTSPSAAEMHTGTEQAGYRPEQGLSVRI
jgi:flagellar hook-length control protein FliK